jgi:hypothetical protein
MGLSFDELELESAEYVPAREVMTTTAAIGTVTGTSMDVTGAPITVSVTGITVGAEPDDDMTTSICFGVDERELSFANPDARALPVGCTAFLIEANSEHCFLTAGHCVASGSSFDPNRVQVTAVIRSVWSRIEDFNVDFFSGKLFGNFQTDLTRVRRCYYRDVPAFTFHVRAAEGNRCRLAPALARKTDTRLSTDN